MKDQNKKSGNIVAAWAILEHGSGFKLHNAIVLLNMRKLKFNAEKTDFSKIEHDDIEVCCCLFITDRKTARKYGYLKDFDLLIYRDEYSKVVNC